MNEPSACRASAIRPPRCGSAGSGRHLDQQLAAAEQHFAGQRHDAFDLVVAVDDLPVDCDPRQVAANPARGDPTFEIVLCIEARDLARVGIRLSVQKPHFLAARQEAERHADLPRVVPCLVLRRDGIDARALGLDHRHGPALPVAKDVVGLRGVRKRVFEQDAHND